MKAKVSRRAAALLALAAIGACGSRDRGSDAGVVADAQSIPAATAAYECDGALEFVARVEGESAFVFLPSGTLRLAHVPSASGARYEGDGVTFWTKGEEATIEAPGIEASNCTNNRRRAIWEHAKLEGVDFRAVGQEPGWHLELREADTSLLVTDYGSARYAFVTPEPDENREARRTVFRAEASGVVITITLEGRRCSDTMSGEEFETTVTITIAETTLSGCGRSLH
jgi:membrane-bound inhibitor of C-type lysozyme